MTNFLKLSVIFSIILSFTACAEAQQQPGTLTRTGQKFTFEGKSIVVDVPDAGRKLAVEYGQNPIITNINGSTPTDITTCTGRAILPQAGRVTVLRDEGTGYWCFRGPAESYTITFPFGDRGNRTYNRWIPKEKTDSGFINIKDFDAKGDGSTDDTEAIRNGIAFIAARQGGTLFFPPGDYIVGGSGEFKGLGLPSGIVIQGSSSLAKDATHNYFEPKQFSQIRVRQNNQRIFRIGEGVTDVKIKNIALRADANERTYGIEAVGDVRGNPTTHVGVEDVSFNNFDIGFYVHNPPGVSPEWQFDMVRVDHCNFIYNRTAGIWVETYNTDWRITSSSFLMPNVAANTPADGIKIKVSGGATLIENCFGGGLSYEANRRGGDFIDIEIGGITTVINSSAERASNSLVYAQTPGTGGYSSPLTLINNSFGDPVRVRRVVLVSTGNFYLAKTVQTGDGAQIYSTGDRFCYDTTQGFAPAANRFPCGASGVSENGFQGEGKIIFQTGQPRDVSQVNPSGTVAERPTIIGTETKFDAPARLASFRANNLPTGREAGTMVFCADCQKNTSPCRAGGDGALAIAIGNRWDCK